MSQPTLDEFRVECLAFLDANAKLREAAQDFKWGEGDDDVAMFEEVDPESERRQIEVAKGWRNARADAGLHWISGPTELGGR